MATSTPYTQEYFQDQMELDAKKWDKARLEAAEVFT